MFIKITFVNREGNIEKDNHYVNSAHILNMYEEDFKGHLLTHLGLINGHSIRVTEKISELLKMIEGGRK